MAALVSFKDTPLQKDFVFNTNKYSAYFGKIRGGKTVGGCARVLMLADIYPGNEILVGRQTYAQLFDTTWRELIGLARKRNGGTTKPGPYIRRYVESNSGTDAHTLFIKTNGGKGEDSKIRARYADDVDSFLSGEWGAFYLDQIEGIEEDVFNQVENRLTYWNVKRCQDFKQIYGYWPKSFGFVTGNPDPGWVHERFKINAKQKYFFLETTIQENAGNLPPGYFDDLARDNPPSWVDRYLNNDWSVKGGQVYKEFNERVHVIQPFAIPNHWPRFVGMDYGYSHPSAVYWIALDEQSRIYFYRELFESGKIASQLAAQITELSKDDPVSRLENHILVYMPADMNKHDGIVNRTVQEEFALYGIQGLKANQSVEAGILKFQERLHNNSVFFFKGCVPALIRGMKTYTRDEVTEKIIKIDDDAVDGARYTLMAALENRADVLPTSVERDEYKEFVIAKVLEESFNEVIY